MHVPEGTPRLSTPLLPGTVYRRFRWTQYSRQQMTHDHRWTGAGSQQSTGPCGFAFDLRKNVTTARVHTNAATHLACPRDVGCEALLQGNKTMSYVQ